MKKKKQIIDLENERYGLFMTQESFDLEVEYGREFLRTDNVQYVIIHRINVTETVTHSLYGQSKPKDKKYFAPIQISCTVKIEDGKQEYYGNYQGGIARDDSSIIILGIFLKELEEKNLEINRGDIIEYNQSGSKNRYYEVENANNVTDETSKTIGSFSTYYKRVTGIPVKEDVTSLLSETKGEFL